MMFYYVVFFLVELSVGMTTEGIDVRSVGNTLTLHETALVEAFNLKAAIEYQLKNCELSKRHGVNLICSIILTYENCNWLRLVLTELKKVNLCPMI